MIIVCDQCNTHFLLRDELIKRDYFKAKCAKCDNIFSVQKYPVEEDPVILEHKHVIKKDERKIFTLCNQKGGVAKTSTCINLGAALAAQGKKVLLIDFDVQASLSELLGCSGEKCFFDVMEAGGTAELSRAILKVSENQWCLPSNSRMALFSKKYLSTPEFEKILRRYLKKVTGFFDFVLIDTPPSLDFFTINALMASDFAIIPTQAEFLAVKGVSHVENMIDVMSEKTGLTIDYKVLITMYEEENIAARVIKSALQNRLDSRIFRTIIVRDRKIQESQITHSSVIQYDEAAAASQQYLQLAKEVLAIQAEATLI